MEKIICFRMLRQFLKFAPTASSSIRAMSSTVGIPRDRLKGKVAIVTASTEGYLFILLL